jgi:hypothetical protein
VSSLEQPRDERPDEDEEELAEPGRDPEVPEADALDQAREVESGERHTPVHRAIDAPEADAIDQAIEVPVEEDDEPAGG